MAYWLLYIWFTLFCALISKAVASAVLRLFDIVLLTPLSLSHSRNLPVLSSCFGQPPPSPSVWSQCGPHTSMARAWQKGLRERTRAGTVLLVPKKNRQKIAN